MAAVRSLLSFVLMFVACGDNHAPVAIDAMPDAAVDAPPACTTPNMMCGASCLDVSVDEENCGSCGTECNGGEACTANACACPSPFIPPTLGADQFDQFMSVGMGISIALNPNFGDGINPFIVGFDAQTALDTDIDLSAIPLGEVPFVGAGYHFDLGTNSLDATYVATAGTLRITENCATHLEGTLAGATFRGTMGGLTNPTIDPDGCMFTVATVTFAMGTTPCQ